MSGAAAGLPSTIGELRDAYAAGLSPVDVVEALLSRREREGVDGTVWISVSPDQALRARAAQLTKQGPQDRPLWGVLFGVKDNIDVAGLPTTAGCAGTSYLPERDAVCVAALLEAGAICVGKTNLDQFATGLSGARSPYGIPENALLPELIPGGSSSGSAVAVARGEVLFALGTDTAGSGRVPAALNGIVGTKPTPGLVSTLGVVPACRSLDCVSVFSRSAADGALVTEVMSVVAADPWQSSRPSDAGTRTWPDLRALRLAVPDARGLDFSRGDGQQDEGMRDAFASVVQRLDAWASTEVAVQPLVEVGDLLYGPFVAERLADLEQVLADPGVEVLPVTRSIIERGRDYSAAELFRAQHRLRALAAEAVGIWDEADVLVLPTVPTSFTVQEMLAEPITRNAVLGRWTHFVNLLGLAAVTMPTGSTADGRPASITLVGRGGTDSLLAALAERLAVDVSERPPSGDAPPGETVLLAVVGRHRLGQSRNSELVLRGATHVTTTTTTPEYRLWAIGPGPDPLPGMLREASGGAPIEVEVWALPADRLADFLAGVPAPLCVGRVRLADGSTVLGFLCEPAGLLEARDVSSFGDWLSFLAAEYVPAPSSNDHSYSYEETA